MKRDQLETYIKETYDISGEHPWQKYANYEVFRHTENSKWFAIIMDISPAKLGLTTQKKTDRIDIVNVKCDSELLETLQLDEGIFPAYHMNKANWISVVIDGYIEDETLCVLLDMSFRATMK